MPFSKPKAGFNKIDKLKKIFLCALALLSVLCLHLTPYSLLLTPLHTLHLTPHTLLLTPLFPFLKSHCRAPYTF